MAREARKIAFHPYYKGGDLVYNVAYNYEKVPETDEWGGVV
jgi:hypothetical protein